MTPGTGRRRLIAGVALGTAFAALTGCVAAGQPFGALDRAVNTAAHHATVAHPALLAAARTVTLLGDAAVLAPLVVLAVALLARTDRRRAVAVLTLTAGAALVHSLLKVLVGRARPTFTDPLVHLASQAFPSGHATTSTVVYGTLLLLTVPRIGPAAGRRLLTLGVAVLVAGVAASRVLLGAHWLTDVVGGRLRGLTWLAVFFPTATRCAGSTAADRAKASLALQHTAPSPFAVTARPDPGAPGAVIRRVRLGGTGRDRTGAMRTSAATSGKSPAVTAETTKGRRSGRPRTSACCAGPSSDPPAPGRPCSTTWTRTHRPTPDAPGAARSDSTRQGETPRSGARQLACVSTAAGYHSPLTGGSRYRAAATGDPGWPLGHGVGRALALPVDGRGYACLSTRDGRSGRRRPERFA